MNKKLLIQLSLVISFSTITLGAMAHSTVYVDDIGRLHFLGKDPGSKARSVQELENFNNSAQKDLTNIIYKNKENAENSIKEVENRVYNDVDEANRKINAEGEKLQRIIEESEKKSKEAKTNIQQHINSSKSSYTFSKGAMDASNPYNYGNTNIERGVNDTKTIYTDDLGRQHFFGKGNIVRE